VIQTGSLMDFQMVTHSPMVKDWETPMDFHLDSLMDSRMGFLTGTQTETLMDFHSLTDLDLETPKVTRLDFQTVIQRMKLLRLADKIY